DRGAGSVVSDSRPIAARVVDRWALVYTSGLSAGVRDERRAELASDVWEQLAAECTAGRRPSAGSLKVISRVVRGIPADVVWRVETRHHLGGLMKGTAIAVARGGSAIAVLGSAFWLFWALAWGSAVHGGISAVFAA